MRAWDAYDVYLFDIDGTLLNSTDAVHYFAFCEALTSVAGRPLNLDGVVAHGNVDVGILRDAFELGRIAESVWRPQLAAMQESMCRFVDERKSELCLNVLPGVRELLKHLRSRGALLGVATGNLAGIGRTKLTQCGLLESFDFGGFSDAYEFRREVFRGALQQALQLAGKQAKVCVVGDTPEDVRAAKANRLDVIAVATGVYSLEDLQVEQPTMLVKSLSELTVGHDAFELSSAMR